MQYNSHVQWYRGSTIHSTILRKTIHSHLFGEDDWDHIHYPMWGLKMAANFCPNACLWAKLFANRNICDLRYYHVTYSFICNVCLYIHIQVNIYTHILTHREFICLVILKIPGNVFLPRTTSNTSNTTSKY